MINVISKFRKKDNKDTKVSVNRKLQVKLH